MGPPAQTVSARFARYETRVRTHTDLTRATSGGLQASLNSVSRADTAVVKRGVAFPA